MRLIIKGGQRSSKCGNSALPPIYFGCDVAVQPTVCVSPPTVPYCLLCGK